MSKVSLQQRMKLFASMAAMALAFGAAPALALNRYGVHESHEIVGNMSVLASQGHVLVPFQGNVQPRKTTLAIEPREHSSAAGAQDVARVRLLAQVDGQVATNGAGGRVLGVGRAHHGANDLPRVVRPLHDQQQRGASGDERHEPLEIGLAHVLGVMALRRWPVDLTQLARDKP